MTERTAVERVAARVLPVNPRGEVLLLHGFDPARPEAPFWFSVGGGLEPGEDDRTAAVRELYEETGIVAGSGALLGPIRTETVDFSWDVYDITQQQTWWALPVGEVEVSFAGLDEIERATTLAYRWWSPAELATTTDAVASDLRLVVSAAVDAVRGH